MASLAAAMNAMVNVIVFARATCRTLPLDPQCTVATTANHNAKSPLPIQSRAEGRLSQIDVGTEEHTVGLSDIFGR